jgi:hypothetical protein
MHGGCRRLVGRREGIKGNERSASSFRSRAQRVMEFSSLGEASTGERQSNGSFRVLRGKSRW